METGQNLIGVHTIRFFRCVCEVICYVLTKTFFIFKGWNISHKYVKKIMKI